MNVELPDGTVLEDVPEGTTQAQLRAKLKGRFGTGAPTPEFDMEAERKKERQKLNDSMSWGEGALVGAGAATERAIRGVTKLLSPVLPQEFSDWTARGDEDAKLYKENRPRGAGAGEIGADIAMSAIPVAKLSKALAAAGALAHAGRAAPALGDVAANAGWAAATNPDERLKAAALGAGGAAGARSVLKLARGATPGQGAQHLIDSGIQPTFGQVVGEGGMIGRAVRSAESSLEHLPFVGRSLTNNRATQREAFQDVMQPEAKMLPLALEYTPRDMIKASQRIGEPVPKLAQVAEDVMGSADLHSGVRASLGGGAALAAAGMYMPKVAIPAAIGVKLYSLPVVQRFLTGQTTPQKAVEGLILQYPELATYGKEALVQYLRSLSTQGAQ
tara:strand:+ start:6238 stop:7401 length:1164 start_codon:yes stop_codon:yes gene_type:complete